MKLLLFSSSSFFLKREEQDKEETLEMIALPLCLLRFVRVRALVAAVALVLGVVLLHVIHEKLKVCFQPLLHVLQVPDFEYIVLYQAQLIINSILLKALERDYWYAKEPVFNRGHNSESVAGD